MEALAQGMAMVLIVSLIDQALVGTPLIVVGMALLPASIRSPSPAPAQAGALARWPAATLFAVATFNKVVHNFSPSVGGANKRPTTLPRRGVSTQGVTGPDQAPTGVAAMAKAEAIGDNPPAPFPSATVCHRPLPLNDVPTAYYHQRMGPQHTHVPWACPACTPSIPEQSHTGHRVRRRISGRRTACGPPMPRHLSCRVIIPLVDYLGGLDTCQPDTWPLIGRIQMSSTEPPPRHQGKPRSAPSVYMS